MTVGQWIVYLVIGLLCGLLGQALVRRSIGGLIVTTLVGLGGAFVGNWIANEIHAPEPLRVSVGGRSIPILWAIIGAAILTVVLAIVQNAASRRS